MPLHPHPTDPDKLVFRAHPAAIEAANIGRLAHAASTFTRERRSNITKADFARKSPQGCARKTLNQVIESLANHSGYKPSEILKAAALVAEQLEAS